MSETEVWKDIPGYEGCYQASNQGRIKSVDRIIERRNGVPQRVREYILSLKSTDHGNHPMVNLSAIDKTRRVVRVHQCVKWAFDGPTPDGMEICHNNGNPYDNSIENLRFDTHTENVRDITRHGNNRNVNKTHCKHGHEYTPENTGAVTTGGRYCKACKADRWRLWDDRKSSKVKGDHCQRGHPLTDDNVYVGSDLRRICLECRSARPSRRSAVCKQGHELTGDNRGSRGCLICRRARQRASRQAA